jgi:hypothetical protein
MHLYTFPNEPSPIKSFFSYLFGSFGSGWEGEAEFCLIGCLTGVFWLDETADDVEVVFGGTYGLQLLHVKYLQSPHFQPFSLLLLHQLQYLSKSLSNFSAFPHPHLSNDATLEHLAQISNL